MRVHVNLKKGVVAVAGYEEQVEERRAGKVAVGAAAVRDAAGEKGVMDGVWAVLGGIAEGGVRGLGFEEFLGWKSSRVQLLGGEGEGGVTVTIPSHGMPGNYKEITDDGLLATLEGRPELRGCVAEVEKAVSGGGDGDNLRRRRVVLSGALGEWFLDHMVQGGKGGNAEAPVAAGHPEMSVEEPPVARRILTLSPRGFAGLLGVAARGDEVARRLIGAGFKKWLVKEND